MESRTRISLRQMLVLVAYLALVMFLIVPKPGQSRFFSGLTWVYHLAGIMHEEKVAWPYVIVGLSLLVGTLPPFLLFRWWTVAAALIAGVTYVLIGYELAAYNFVF